MRETLKDDEKKDENGLVSQERVGSTLRMDEAVGGCEQIGMTKNKIRSVLVYSNYYSWRI